MDAKITLSFNEEVISKAKEYAAANNISLSRLIEFLLTKVTTKQYQNLEDFPIADWVTMIAEGEAIYHTKKGAAKKLKDVFFESRK